MFIVKASATYNLQHELPSLTGTTLPYIHRMEVKWISTSEPSTNSNIRQWRMSTMAACSRTHSPRRLA